MSVDEESAQEPDAEGSSSPEPLGRVRVLRRIATSMRSQVVYRILATGLGLAYIAYVTRELGPAAFGALTWVLSVWTLFSVPIGLGAGYTFVVEYLDEARDPAEVFGTFMTLGLGSVALAAVLLLLGAPHVSADPMRVLLLQAMIVNCLALGLRLAHMELYASERLHHWERYRVIQTAANLALAFVALRSRSGVGGVVAASITANMISALLVLVDVKGRRQLRVAWNSAIARRLIAGGLPVMFGIGVQVLLSRLDILMLDSLADTTAVGVYGAALRFLEMAQLPVGMLLGTAFAASVRARLGDPEESSGLFFQVWRGLVLIGVPMAVGIGIAAPGLTSFLFGTGFDGAVPALRLLAPQAAIACYLGLAHQALILEKKELEIFLSAAVAVTLNGALNWVWIPSHGTMGAAAASLTSAALLAAILHVRTRQRTKLDLARLFHPEVLRILASGALMGAALWPIQERSVALIMPVAGLAYGVALLLTGALSKSEVGSLFGFAGGNRPVPVKPREDP